MSRAFDLIVEIQHLRGALLENRIDFLRQKFIPLLIKYVVDALERDDIGHYHEILVGLDIYNQQLPQTAIAEKLFDHIVNLDPTPTKKYTQWLLNTFINKEWPLEDGYKATEYLTTFARINQQMPTDKRDINRYRSLKDLFDTIQPFMRVQSQREVDREYDRKMHNEAEVIYNDKDYKIVVPKTKEASCYFGRNTQWCTAATSSYNAFNAYNNQGPLYIILDKKHNKRWQFHFATEQYMDENDKEINGEQFTRQHPKIAKFLADRLAVAWIQGFPVFRLTEGYLVRESLFSQIVITGINIDKKGNLTGIYPSIPSEMVGSFAQFLNAHHIEPSENIALWRFNLRWHDGKWYSEYEGLIPYLLMDNGYTWVNPRTDTFYLIEAGNLKLSIEITKKYVEVDTTDFAASYADQIAALLNKIGISQHTIVGSEPCVIWNGSAWKSIVDIAPAKRKNGKWSWYYDTHLYALAENRKIVLLAVDFDHNKKLKVTEMSDNEMNPAFHEWMKQVIDLCNNEGYTFLSSTAVRYLDLTLEELHSLKHKSKEINRAIQIIKEEGDDQDDEDL